MFSTSECGWLVVLALLERLPAAFCMKKATFILLRPSAGLCSLASRSQDAGPAGHGSTSQGAFAGECSLRRPSPIRSCNPAGTQRFSTQTLHLSKRVCMEVQTCLPAQQLPSSSSVSAAWLHTLLHAVSCCPLQFSTGSWVLYPAQRYLLTCRRQWPRMWLTPSWASVWWLPARASPLTTRTRLPPLRCLAARPCPEPRRFRRVCRTRAVALISSGSVWHANFSNCRPALIR